MPLLDSKFFSFYSLLLFCFVKLIFRFFSSLIGKLTLFDSPGLRY